MSRAGGGGGGTSAYNKQQVTLQPGTSSATGVDPYIEVEYKSPSGTGTVIKTTTNISGATGSRLRIKRDTVGIHDTFNLACTSKYYEDAVYFGHPNCSDNLNRSMEK